jgi:trimeric autotransporter adhesin
VTGNETVTGNVSASQLISTVANGTSPLKVTSTTLVPNLNASLLGGLSASAFAKLGSNTFLGSQFIHGGAGANGLVGIGDAGCGPGFGAIGFGVNGLNGCTNWSLLGDGINTVVGRPTGGGLFFEQAGTGVADMQINPDGKVQINGSLGIGSPVGIGTPALVAGGGGGASGAANNGAVGIAARGGDAGCCNGSGHSGTGGAGILARGGTANGAIFGVPPGVGGSFTGGSTTSCAGECGADGIHATPGLGSDGMTPAGFAGVFIGDINVTGQISAGTKDFKIDHPLDPANKYLVHSSVESSEMMNLYTGNATLDGNGEATVPLPSWFQAENTDFRYQLTAIGAPGPNLHISQEVANNQFKIAGGAPGMEVSWQITGIRQDAFAKANPLEVESAKPARELGFYIHPRLFGQPEEKSIEWARHPELMKQIKAMQQKPARPSLARPAPAPSTGKIE